MKHDNHARSKSVMRLASALGIAVCALILLLVGFLVLKNIDRTGVFGSAPNYVADTVTVYACEPLPQAADLLTAEAQGIVTAVAFQTTPTAAASTQTVGVLLTFSDGKTRVENTTITIKSTELHWEMGTDSSAAALLGEAYADAVLTTNISQYRTPGTYPLTVTIDGTAYDFTVAVIDSVAPVAAAKSTLSFCLGESPLPLDFVDSYTDGSDVSAAFVSEPDTTAVGNKTAVISLTDAAGNQTLLEVPYTVTEDSDAPIISGYEETLQTAKGVAISPLHGVTAEDRLDGALTVTASMTAEEIKKLDVGTYVLTYTATDLTGNTAEKSVSLVVLPLDTDPQTFTQNDIYRMGYAITESVLNDEMDETKRARTLYNYVQGHMFYKDNKDEMEWYHAAYLAIIRAYGDCRNYYAYARLLLDCAGFENMMVEHTPSSATASRHFWNLVVIDGEWYHFDTTPRVGQSNFFMWTDAQMDSYSRSHGNCFARDESLYPATP